MTRAFLLSLFTLSSSLPALAAEPPAPFALRDGDRVVFYGDSITQEGGYARLVEEYVRTRFPAWDVRFHNAGVGGDTVRGGWAGDAATRLERDVIAWKPTVVTIMLGMNDGGYKPFDPMTLAQFGEGYRAIVAKLKATRPGVRQTLILSSPFDDVSRPPLFAPGYDDVLRRLGCYATALGAQEGATVVDFRNPLNAGIAAVARDNPELARLVIPDRVHPGTAGKLVMGATLLRAWNAPPLVTHVEIDAASKTVSAAENTEVGGLAVVDGGLAWTQADRSLPLPLSFDDADTELAQRAGADLEGLARQPLAVRGLAAGRYELRIDGQVVGRFTEAELAAGVNLARFDTPMRRQAFRVRWSVGDSHERQRVRRQLMAGAPNDPAASATAESLAAVDEAAQAQRSKDAAPQPRRYELVVVP